MSPPAKSMTARHVLERMHTGESVKLSHARGQDASVPLPELSVVRWAAEAVFQTPSGSLGRAPRENAPGLSKSPPQGWGRSLRTYSRDWQTGRRAVRTSTHWTRPLFVYDSLFILRDSLLQPRPGPCCPPCTQQAAAAPGGPRGGSHTPSWVGPCSKGSQGLGQGCKASGGDCFYKKKTHAELCTGWLLKCSQFENRPEGTLTEQRRPEGAGSEEGQPRE